MDRQGLKHLKVDGDVIGTGLDGLLERERSLEGGRADHTVDVVGNEGLLDAAHDFDAIPAVLVEPAHVDGNV